MPTKARLFALASLLIPLVIYLLTICPTIFVGDSGELILSASRLEISHPPGYPFFTMIGRLFSLLPISNLAFRFYLLSALLTSLLSLLLFSRCIRLASGTELAERAQAEREQLPLAKEKP
ncbi:MAG: protein O-mannosyl-transferase family [Candidatus Zixiibacteriota bacterium]